MGGAGARDAAEVGFCVMPANAGSDAITANARHSRTPLSRGDENAFVGISMSRRSFRPRHRPRADPLSLGDAAGCRRPALPSRPLRKRGLRDRTPDFLGAGHARRAQPLRALRNGRAQSRLRRAHRCRSARRCGALALRPFRRRGGGWRPLRARGLRHEGRARGGGRRRAALHGQASVRRFGQLPRHRRRGGAFDQRHGEAARMGGVTGRALRPLHRRRADLS